MYDPICHFQGCDNRSAALGICTAHYKMMTSKGVLRPLYTSRRRNWESITYDESGHKQCAMCREFLPLINFGRSNRSPDKLRGTCTPCRSRTEGSTDRVIIAKANRYGVSPEWIYEEFERQNGTCPGCLTPFISISQVHIDHDHACCGNDYGICGKCVRGLLCSSCNMGLGMLKDNTETLSRLGAYLARYEESK